MGLEARCIARYGGQVSEGKAHLDSEELVFRGDFRLVVPFRSVTRVGAREGRLEVVFGDGAAVFELGPAAEKWAEKIRSPKSVIDKLGVKPEHVVAVFGETGEALRAMLCERVGEIHGFPPPEPVDVLFLMASDRAALHHLPALRAHLKPDGAVWVIRPKGVKEITEADVMAAGKEAGLVDVKVVKFSETHTAEKLVIPKAQRSRP